MADLSKYKKTGATGGVDLSRYRKQPTVTAPSFTATPSNAITGANTTGLLGALSRGVTDFGVGVGSAIGKAGLGLGETALKGVGQIARVTGGAEGKKVWDDLAGNVRGIRELVYDQEQFKRSRDSIMGGLGTGVGTAALYLAPSGTVTKAQGIIDKTIKAIPAASKGAQFARGALGIAGRAVPEALSGGAVALTASGGDMEEAKKAALLQGGLSAAFGTVGAGARAIQKADKTRDVLSATSGIPREAIDVATKQGINNAATPEASLKAARETTRALRKRLTADWSKRVLTLADEFSGQRMGLTDDQISQFAKVADEFGIDPTLIPRDLRSMSVKESLDLMKGLNELDSLAVKSSPKGAIVRQLREQLRSRVLQNFGGDGGSVAALWKDYSSKKGIHDSIDNIVRAYTSNKPISEVTAKNRLMAIFDDNKPEFLKAVRDLEEEMGVNLTKDIASTKFKDILPRGVVKADGGLPTRTGVVDQLWRMLFLPLTSPRIVGNIVKPAEKPSPAIERLFGS